MTRRVARPGGTLPPAEAWAFGDVAGLVTLENQVGWLDRVLRSRDYPMDNFYSAIRDAADVVDEQVPDGAPVAARLRDVCP